MIRLCQRKRNFGALYLGALLYNGTPRSFATPFPPHGRLSSRLSTAVDRNDSQNRGTDAQVSLPNIAVIGSGNFGSAIARRLAVNRQMHYPNIDHEIKMWVYEEIVDGKNLTEIINEDHMNTKYLPNVLLPDSIRAVSSLQETCKDADVLLFIVSHKHLPAILEDMKGHTKPSAVGVSLVKGVNFSPDGPSLISEAIKQTLGLREMAVIMGANLASDVAYDRFVETTVACPDIKVARQIAGLLECSNLRTQLSTDVSTAELCGALKNVVAVGAGLCDGMGLGASTKAALMRQGLEEIRTFCKLFDVHGNFTTDTLMLSCGVADLMATCAGGRNRLCSAAYAQRVIADSSADFTMSHIGGSDGRSRNRTERGDEYATGDEKVHTYDAELEVDDKLALTLAHKQLSAKQLLLMQSLPSGQPLPQDPWQSQEDAAAELWREIEGDLLHGQVLQGVDTCKEVVRCLTATGHIQEESEGSTWGAILGLGGGSSGGDSGGDGGDGGNGGNETDREKASKQFPLFERINAIACKGEDLNTLFNWD